jgi:pimeloyl-ACP methyl ester carboxylesterase
MTQTEILFAQSEFALASYAKNLFFGISDSAYQTALEDGGKGMSQSQAVTFIENWRVLDQYTDPTSGLSATIFQKTAGGPRYLAIRGTEASGSDVAADGILALGIPSGLNPQFAALKTKLETEWLAEGGPLYNQNFTVSGHSLGGYLAAAVKQQYGAQVTDAYLFNAPGVGGLFGNLADALTGALGLSGAPVGNIWNVRGSEGFPFIAGLGSQLGTAVSVQIEAASGVGLNNHSIVGLTDALAIQAVYARLAPSLTQSELNALIDASGDPMALTHESALDALRTLFAGTEAIPTGIDRDRYYSHLNALQDDSGYKALAAAGAQIVVLANLTIDQVKTLAQGSDTQALRHATPLKLSTPLPLSARITPPLPPTAHSTSTTAKPASAISHLTTSPTAPTSWCANSGLAPKTGVRSIRK